MQSRARGFTLIELVVVIMVGAILTTIAIRTMGGTQSAYAVRASVQTLAGLHARARATAIERGETVKLYVDTEGDSVAITRGGAVVETVRFLTGEFETDIQGDEEDYTLCMTARGFADDSCNSFTGAATITFAQGAETASARMLPLGQLIF